MILIYAILFVDFTLLLFSKFLFVHFHVNIISIQPIVTTIQYVVLFILIIFVITKWIIKREKTKLSTSEKNKIVLFIVVLSVIPCFIGWSILGSYGTCFNGSNQRIYDIDDDKIILIVEIPSYVSTHKLIFLGKQMLLGYMYVEEYYNCDDANLPTELKKYCY